MHACTRARHVKEIPDMIDNAQRESGIQWCRVHQCRATSSVQECEQPHKQQIKQPWTSVSAFVEASKYHLRCNRWRIALSCGRVCIRVVSHDQWTDARNSNDILTSHQAIAARTIFEHFSRCNGPQQQCLRTESFPSPRVCTPSNTFEHARPTKSKFTSSYIRHNNAWKTHFMSMRAVV
jgi:hypothetical protein